MFCYIEYIYTHIHILYHSIKYYSYVSPRSEARNSAANIPKDSQLMKDLATDLAIRKTTHYCSS